MKDACELIDYDSDMLIPTDITMNKTSYIYREDNDIYRSEENIQNDKEDDKEKLMKINVYYNKDIYFEFERNAYEYDETDNICTPNTAWFLLKPGILEVKMNRYKLNPGEIIRIGRITMRIRDIIFGDKNNNKELNESFGTNYNIKETQTEGMPVNTIDNMNSIRKDKNKNNNKNKINEIAITKSEPQEKLLKINVVKNIKQNESIFSKVEKKNILCRICYMEEESPKNPLIQPCICDGSLKYVHLACLRQWISTHSCVRIDKNENCAIFLIKPVECELCKTKFPDYIKHLNKTYPLLDFSNEYESYLSLESLTLDKHKNKFIYVVSLEKSGKIKAGRGSEANILLSDISVSRIHCFMVVENKNVFLEDNNSKFGTLVLIQNKRIKLSQELPLFVQVGRTFCQITVKKKFKFFNCCEADEKYSIYSYYYQNEKYIKSNFGLIIKEDEISEEDDYKNYNTQELIDKNNFKNDSININTKDKMSDNEYILIKRNKKNKNIRKNIFLEEEEEDGNENNNENKHEICNNEDEEEVESLRQNEENVNREENENNEESAVSISESGESGRNNNNDSTFEQNG